MKSSELPFKPNRISLRVVALLILLPLADKVCCDERKPKLPAKWSDRVIGKVEGKQILVSEILGPIYPHIHANRETQSIENFNRWARKLIRERAYQVLFDTLTVHRIASKLDKRSKEKLANIMSQVRLAAVEQYGKGDKEEASQRLRELTGGDLQSGLDRLRATILLRHHQRQLKSNVGQVSSQEIHEYFSKNKERYGGVASRQFRLIQVDSADKADHIDKELQAGKPFEKVASGSTNMHRPKQGGDLGVFLEGKKPFSKQSLNKVAFDLKAGQHSKRILLGKFFLWVAVDRITPARSKPSNEDAKWIEESIKATRLQRMAKQHKDASFREGSFTPLNEIEDAALEEAQKLFTGVVTAKDGVNFEQITNMQVYLELLPAKLDELSLTQ